VVSPASPDGYYAPTASLTVTAKANQGFSFGSWTGAAAGVPFNVTSPSAVTANFNCVYTVGTPATLTSAAGSFSLAVNTGAGCAYTASSSASWITLTNTSGTGNSGVAATYTANTTGVTRTGTLTIAGQTITVTQNIMVQVTIVTSPAGGNVIVDGVSRRTPFVTNWNPGSGHGVTAQTPQTGLVFSNWSDGPLTAGRTIYAPATPQTYTAYFCAQ